MRADEIERLPYRPCVGVMLVNADKAVFVGERIDTPGAWQMPQGGIDPGETPPDAALRELAEETGVPPEWVEVLAETDRWLTYDLPHEIVPKIWKGRFRGQQQKWVLMRFLGSDAEIDIAADHREFRAWRWLPPSAVLAHIVPFKRPVYAAVLDAFAEYLS